MTAASDLDIAPWAFLLVGVDGRVRSSNQAAATLFGTPPTQSTLEALFAEPEPVRRQLEAARASAQPVCLRHRVANGERFVELALRSTDGPAIAAYALDVTVEIRHQRQAEWLALALESFRTVVWELDLRTGRTQREGPIHEVLGPSFGPTGSLPEFLAQVSADDRGPLKAELERVARQGGLAQRELRWSDARHPGERWLHVAVRGLLDETGTPVRVIGATIDVSATHAESHRTADLRARYEAVVESTHEGILAVDGAERVVVGNRAAASLFGRPVGELVGAPISSLLADHDGTRQRPPEASRHVATKVAGLRRDGSRVPLEASITRTGTASGDMTTFVLRDARGRAALSGDLARSHARFANAFQMSPTPSCIVGVEDRRILEVNEAFARLVGRPADVLIGQALESTKTLDPQVDVVGLLETARAERRLPDTRIDVVTSTDERRSCRIAANAVDSPDGAIWLMTWIDETEVLALDAARRRADTTIERTFRLAPCGIAIVRATDRVVVEANDAMLELAGLTALELIGRSLFDGGVQLTRPAEVWEALARDGRVRDVPVTLRRRDGSERFATVAAEMMDVAGVPHALVVWNDETERRRVEAREQEATRRLTDFANAIHEVFWLIDLETGAPLYISPGYERVWGRPVSDVFARSESWLEAIHPDDRDRVRARTGVNHSSEPTEIEYRILRPDGAVAWIRDISFPVRDERGRVTRKAGVCEDVTERRRVETQLHEAQKMESMGKLAGGVAHDFNNILTVVAACSDILSEAFPEGSSDGEVVDELRLACERASSLTRQLLAFSRREVVETKVLEPLTVVRDTSNMLRRVLGEDVLLRSLLAPRTACIRVDPGQLVQVVMNLAVNARDAMPQGGTLTIETSDEVLGAARCTPECPPGPYVRISVRDTGSGMSPEVQQHIFEPFFTTKGVGRGTGLGLSVVHGIVRQAGGFVCVRSEVGVGSTFEVYLPAVSEAADGARPRSASKDGHGERILLVEDDDSVRRIAASALSAHGYDVVQAGNGARGLEALRKSAAPVALVVTDVVMPELDGRHFVEQALNEAPHLKILYTSGYTDDAIVRHGIQQASVAFLPKPYSVATLLQRIRDALDAH